MTNEEAVAAVARFLVQQNLRPESLFAMTQAAVATTAEGVGGLLLIKIPRKNDSPIDVSFTTGQAGVELKF